MPFYRSELGIVHMKGTKLPAPCCAGILIDGKHAICLVPSGYLCDGPPSPASARNHHGSGTCDRPICQAHATQIAVNRHLCPSCHQAQSDAQGQRSLFTSLVQS